jgi:hypothetical protein
MVAESSLVHVRSYFRYFHIISYPVLPKVRNFDPITQKGHYKIWGALTDFSVLRHKIVPSVINQAEPLHLLPAL